MARTKKSGVLRSAVAGGVGAVLVAALAACSSSGSSSGPPSGSSSGAASKPASLTNVTLIIPSLSANQALGFIALKAGIFKKNGLNVKTVNAGTGALAVEALTGGSGQFVVTGSADLFSAAKSGQHLYILAKASSGLSTQIVLTSAGVKATGLTASAPLAQRIKALNGLTIASPSAASSWTAQAAKAAATQGATIKFTYVQENSMAAAMQAGKIDGLVAAPPWSTEALYAKTGTLWLSGPGGTFPGGYAVSSYGDPLVATTQAYGNAHPKVTEEFTKSILQAGALLSSQPAQAAAYVKQVAYPTMSEAEFQQVWAATMPLLHTPSLSLQSLTATLALDGDSTLDATAMYPSKILSAVGSG
jgi:ABC-type nitrate/sulfonate/bicarbonate transport system substrate-binding protein